MTTQFIRTIDRWRFETPLALGLCASAGFAALTAPAQLMAQVPVAGDMGSAGRAIVAVLLAAVAGGAGYVAMRRPVKAAPAPAAASEIADPVEEIPEDERPSGMPAERFARFRRADAHPDAPQRQPIIASRDLGEPFMEVDTTPPAADAKADGEWWPETAIPDGEFVEVDEEAAPVAAEAPEAEPVAVETPPVEAAVVETPASAAPRAENTSIAAMMDRLSAGLERRAAIGAPPRDPSPALRDALAELNRLAERRH